MTPRRDVWISPNRCWAITLVAYPRGRFIGRCFNLVTGWSTTWMGAPSGEVQVAARPGWVPKYVVLAVRRLCRKAIHRGTKLDNPTGEDE